MTECLLHISLIFSTNKRCFLICTMRMFPPFRSVPNHRVLVGQQRISRGQRETYERRGYGKESALRFALRQVGAERHESRSRRRDQCTRGRLRSQPLSSASFSPRSANRRDVKAYRRRLRKRYQRQSRGRRHEARGAASTTWTKHDENKYGRKDRREERHDGGALPITKGNVEDAEDDDDGDGTTSRNGDAPDTRALCNCAVKCDVNARWEPAVAASGREAKWASLHGHAPIVSRRNRLSTLHERETDWWEAELREGSSCVKEIVRADERLEGRSERETKKHPY